MADHCEYEEFPMNLSKYEWELIHQTLGYVGLMGRDVRAKELADKIGPQGECAAIQGVGPADPMEGPPPGWHESIPVEEKVNEAFEEYVEEYDNLKAILIALGNRLVDEHGFKPGCAIFDPKRDGNLLRTTQVIAMFVAWVNQVPAARAILREHGFEWPLGRQRGREDRACNFA